MAGSSKASPVDDEVPDWMDEDDGNKDEGVEEDTADDQGKTGEGEEGEVEDTGEGKIFDVFLWEHHELVCRELLNCFPSKTVVHHNTNVSWPLACARQCIPFVGFARSEEHAGHIHKTLVAKIVAEIIENKTDGFSAKRFLSKQRSVAGSTEDGGGQGLDGGAGAKKADGGSAAGGSAAADGATLDGDSDGSSSSGETLAA